MRSPPRVVSFLRQYAVHLCPSRAPEAPDVAHLMSAEHRPASGLKPWGDNFLGLRQPKNKRSTLTLIIPKLQQHIFPTFFQCFSPFHLNFNS